MQKRRTLQVNIHETLIFPASKINSNSKLYPVSIDGNCGLSPVDLTAGILNINLTMIYKGTF